MRATQLIGLAAMTSLVAACTAAVIVGGHPLASADGQGQEPASIATDSNVAQSPDDVPTVYETATPYPYDVPGMPPVGTPCDAATFLPPQALARATGTTLYLPKDWTRTHRLGWYCTKGGDAILLVGRTQVAYESGWGSPSGHGAYSLASYATSFGGTFSVVDGRPVAALHAIDAAHGAEIDTIVGDTRIEISTFAGGSVADAQAALDSLDLSAPVTNSR